MVFDLVDVGEVQPDDKICIMREDRYTLLTVGGRAWAWENKSGKVIDLDPAIVVALTQLTERKSREKVEKSLPADLPPAAKAFWRAAGKARPDPNAPKPPEILPDGPIRVDCDPPPMNYKGKWILWRGYCPYLEPPRHWQIVSWVFGQETTTAGRTILLTAEGACYTEELLMVWDECPPPNELVSWMR